MLFDLKPKENRKELFGRDEEYSELDRLLKSGSWVVVLGKRMTGKTSLVKTYSKERQGVYVNLMAAKGIEGFAHGLLAALGFRLSEVGIDLKLIHARWSSVAENGLSRVGDRILVLDEVQEVSSPQFLKLLKSAWDTYGKLRIVMTGSMLGVMKGLLQPSAGSPLYGRTPAKIVLRTFSREASSQFLTQGFREFDHHVGDSEATRVIDRLNGYVGWLTYYGHCRAVRKLSHEQALDATESEGAKLIASELDHFLRRRRRDIYVSVLRMVARGARWSEILGEVRVNSKVLRDILKILIDATLVDNHQGLYTVEDPILRLAVRRLRQTRTSS